MQPTLCSRCGKNVAVVFITKIENGQAKNEGLCLRCISELRHMVHEGLVAGFFGSGCHSVTGMFEVETVTAGPLPGVIEIEHGFHVTLRHFGKQIIESVEDGIVIDTGGYLKRGFYLRFHSAFAVTAHQNTKVIQPQGV